MKQSEAQNKATRVLYDPEAQKGTLKSIGGSQSDDWNDILANQTVQALWLKRPDPSTRYEQYSASTLPRTTRMPSISEGGLENGGDTGIRPSKLPCVQRPQHTPTDLR